MFPALRHYHRKSSGFTLIELLLVVAIVSLLASAVFSNAAQASMRARDTQRLFDLRQIQTAFEEYKSDHSKYPDGEVFYTIWADPFGCSVAGYCGVLDTVLYPPAGTRYMSSPLWGRGNLRGAYYIVDAYSTFQLFATYNPGFTNFVTQAESDKFAYTAMIEIEEPARIQRQDCPGGSSAWATYFPNYSCYGIRK